MVAERWAEWPLANVDGLTVTRHKDAGRHSACPVDSPPLGWPEACWTIRHRHRLPLVVVARMPCGSIRCCYPARPLAAAVERIALQEGGVAREHHGHAPRGQPGEGSTILIEAIVGHNGSGMVLGNANDPQIAIGLGRRLH